MHDDRYLLSTSEWADLKRRFTYQAPIAGQPERYQEIRATAFELARRISVLCPPSRERALAITNLEQAVMWANASIARHEHE
jgi:hypothetical protein